jgi:hypothetical protein
MNWAPIDWKLWDSPPAQRHPVPRVILEEASCLAIKYRQHKDLAITDLIIWIGFFYLL